MEDLAEAWNVEFDHMVEQYPGTDHVDAAEWAIPYAFQRTEESTPDAEDWLRDYIAERIDGFPA